MRLSEQQRLAIKSSVNEIFGQDALVWLFGSRVDDYKRGGDIDIFIEAHHGNADEIIRAEIALQTKLQRVLGEQKIDVLLSYPSRKSYPPIFAIAKQTGVLL